MLNVEVYAFVDVFLNHLGQSPRHVSLLGRCIAQCTHGVDLSNVYDSLWYMLVATFKRSEGTGVVYT